MLKFSHWGGACLGVLAHTHWLVAVIHLAHFAFLAVMVQAGVWKENAIKTQKQFFPFLFLLCSKKFPSLLFISYILCGRQTHHVAE